MSTEQQQIISALGSVPAIDPESEVDRRIGFLMDYARSVPGVRGFVLGISGGQDSSLAGRIAQLAAERLRSEGHDARFVAVRLPYREQHDEDDARLALDFIRPDEAITVAIGSAVDEITAAVSEGSGAPVTDFTKGNVKARMRMVAQYTVAGDRGLLVIGTDHAAEAVTGFYTKHGDGAADVLPLSGLTKSQGARMLEHLGAPDRLWTKTPTADLLDDEPGQADEQSLGLTYAEIDAYLQGETVDAEVAENIERRYTATEHKRRMPVAPDDTWWMGEREDR